MKTKNLFKCLVAVIALFTYSCSSDDGGGTPTPGDGGGSGITSITVAVSNSSIELGGSVTFTVTANDGSNVTSNSTILVNNSSIQGASYTPPMAGTYAVTATNGSLTSSAVSLEVTPSILTALRVESVSTSIKIGDTADFVVIGTDAFGNDSTVTGAAIISVNGVQIDGNRFMATVMGDLEATATKDVLTSAIFTLPVVDETAPATFARNAVIEDFTGTWCGWCPRVSYGIEQVEAASDRVFAIAAHSGDNMENSYSSALVSQFNPGGSYPTAVINRDAVWTYPEPDNVAQATNLATGTTSTGLSLNSMLVGNQLKVYVSSAFAQSTTGAKLVVLVLEDGIVASQGNYTSYYGGVDPIPQFEHHHTLRHSMTNVLGDAIANTAANSKNQHVFDIPVPSLVNDRSKMTLVAMIVGSDNKVLNATGAHVGTDKDYEAN
jgi:hypothetical protein